MTILKINRRTFLGVMACAIISVTGPVHAFGSLLKREGEVEDLADKLAELFARRESALFIGEEYFRSAHAVTDRDVLVERICSFQEGWGRKLMEADARQMRRLLSYQQRLDFEYGRIIRIDGWMLSETEVYLCALTVLH